MRRSTNLRQRKERRQTLTQNFLGASMSFIKSRDIHAKMHPDIKKSANYLLKYTKELERVITHLLSKQTTMLKWLSIDEKLPWLPGKKSKVM
jgi:hypothetical protein